MTDKPVALEFQVELWEFRNVYLAFGDGGPWKKPSEQVQELINKLNPHMTQSQGIEPGLHWLEVNTFNTTPSLLSQVPD